MKSTLQLLAACLLAMVPASHAQNNPCLGELACLHWIRPPTDVFLEPIPPDTLIKYTVYAADSCAIVGAGRQFVTYETSIVIPGLSRGEKCFSVVAEVASVSSQPSNTVKVYIRPPAPTEGSIEYR